MSRPTERFKPDLGPPAAPDFDEDRARGLIDRVYERIEGFYVPGALPWAKEARRDLYDRKCGASNLVDTAFAAQDLEAMRRALQDFGAAVREICEACLEERDKVSAEALPEPEALSLFAEDDKRRQEAQRHRGAL